jgi:nicotinate-nucleotide adenylyltransferase
VMERPGPPMAALEASLPPWAGPRLCRERGQLARAPGGRIMLQRVQPQDISASAIRAMIAAAGLPQGLLPEAVWNYIQANRLYGYRSEKA